MNLKDIPGYEGTYAANEDGDVFRLRTYGSRPKPLLRSVAKRIKKGYAVAHFCQDGVRKDVPIHRSVWQAFNGAIPDGLEVNHKNGQRADNRLSNLELVTKSGNALHKFRVNGFRSKGRSEPGEKNPASKLNEASVIEIRSTYAAGQTTQKQLALRFGVSQPMIGLIVRRKKWQHLD